MLLGDNLPIVSGFAGILLYAVFFVLIGAAYFSAQRYRLSRTEWQGVRGGMVGSAWRYGFVFAGYFLLQSVTLGQATPWAQVGLAERRIGASRLGSGSFRFKGKPSTLYPIFLGTWMGCLALLGVILAIGWAYYGDDLRELFSSSDQHPIGFAHIVPVAIVVAAVYSAAVGLLFAWYAASVARHIAANTTLETLRFSSDMTAARLFWLMVDRKSTRLNSSHT